MYPTPEHLTIYLPTKNYIKNTDSLKKKSIL